MGTVSSYSGDCKIDHTPSAAVAAGDVVVLNDLICVAERPIAIASKGSLSIEGTYIFPKATGAIGAGAIVYWDATNSNITTTSTSNKRAGKAAEAAASGDATVKVLINQG